MGGSVTAKNIDFNHKGKERKGIEFTITLPLETWLYMQVSIHL